MTTSNFKFSGNCGDIISLIPAIRKYYQLHDKKAVLYLWLNKQAFYYYNAIHPVVDEQGNNVMLNEKMFNLIRPLLLAQDCIDDVRIWKGEEIKVDFDKLYEGNIMNKPYGSLNRWPFYIYPNLSTDLSVVYLNVPEKKDVQYKNKIIINRTQRYTNQMINYFFLKDHKEEIVFTGTKYEHEVFCNEFELDVEYYEAPDFLSLAQEIKQCRFYIGNQSMCYQIAEGLKVPRILEVCAAYPNIIPIGRFAYDFHEQLGLDFYFNELLKQTKIV